MAGTFVAAIRSSETARRTQKVTTGRYIPSTYTERREFEGGVIYYSPDKRNAIAYQGRRTRPDWHRSFRTDEQFWSSTNAFVRAVGEVIELKRTRQAIDIREHVREGDVYVCSWGYDQTNVDAYQVVRVVGKRMVEVRQIATAPVKGSDGFMANRVVPLRDDFIREEVLRKRVDAYETGGEVRTSIAFEYGGAGKWNGQAEYRQSWYA